MRKLFLPLLLLLAACVAEVPRNARIIVAGDSVMAWNGASRNVAAQLQRILGEPVGDVSLSLARVDGGIGPLNIPQQINAHAPEWVVLNGGANDLSQNCGCSDCAPVLDQLVSTDGRSGAIPDLVASLRAKGSKVVWVDYYTAPRYAGTTCEAPYQALEMRLSRMAARDAGVTLVDLDQSFRHDDLLLFANDRIHPSTKGSALIAHSIAQILKGK